MEDDSRPIVTAALVAGLLAGYGIALPVGAVATYLVGLTARTSLKVGALGALGVATADGLYALVAMVGGSTLVPVIQPVMRPLCWASALLLVALAVRGGTTAIRRYGEPGRSTLAEQATVGAVQAYLGLLGMTMLNPTTVIYFAALVVGSRTTAAATEVERLVFVLAAFAASASWQLLLACGGALLGRTLTGRRGRLVTTLASSILISALAVRLVVTSS